MEFHAEILNPLNHQALESFSANIERPQSFSPKCLNAAEWMGNRISTSSLLTIVVRLFGKLTQAISHSVWNNLWLIRIRPALVNICIARQMFCTVKIGVCYPAHSRRTIMSVTALKAKVL